MFLLELSDEQTNIIQMVQDFVAKEVEPFAGSWDEENIFPLDTFHKLSELGFSGMTCGDEYGGSFLDYLTRALVYEELSKGCTPLAATLAVHNMVADTIFKHGSEDQKRNWLPLLNSGEVLAAYALTEPNAGSDAAALETTALKQNGEYVLNGNKIFITSAGEAGLYLVMAKTDKAKKARGISAFLVKKETPGFTFGKKEKKMGFGVSVTGELIFDDCRVPQDSLLGNEGDGFKYALGALDSGRVNLGALGIGLAGAAFAYALEYAKNRKQFGQALSSFQGIQFMLADMATEIEAAKAIVYGAAMMVDRGSSPRSITLAAAMAKRFATDMAMRVTTDAVQILGGYGYIKDYPVERYMREAKMLQIVEGTNQIQRMVIARELLLRK